MDSRSGPSVNSVAPGDTPNFEANTSVNCSGTSPAKEKVRQFPFNDEPQGIQSRVRSPRFEFREALDSVNDKNESKIAAALSQFF